MKLLSDLRVRLPRTVMNFTHNDALGGIIMMFCIVLALILQNGSYSTSYRHGIEMSAGVVFGDFQLIKPLLLWINDGLITIFFFSIGLQLKIEFVKGNLSNPRNIILPALAALGGILTPALVFTLFNHDNEYAMNGWAIPTSTDTAFSIALLLLLGSRVPASLKILLLSTSVFDDMGAMIILAIFYTTELSISALVLAGCAVFGLLLLNYFGVGRKLLYLILGVVLWFAILKSGMHPTLAGIITAFLIPMKSAYGEHMVEPISESLQVWVALFVLPLFTLANAGIDLSMMDVSAFFAPVSLGIFFALTVGKPLGIFLVIWLAIKVRLVKQPVDANMLQIYGMCTLTGIGFSMAFFYDSLAYQGSSVFNYADALAILVASFVSGVYGYLFLRFVACRTAAIEYRPWLPSPSGYKGTARTANLYTLDTSTQGPASVAPTAALVAEANARTAAAAAAAAAADKAAQAAKQAAEAAKQAAELDDEADDETLAKVQLAAAEAAAAAASAAVSTAKLDESDEGDTAEVAEAALEAANVATKVAKEIVAEVVKEESASEDSQDEDKDDEDKVKLDKEKSSSKSTAKAKASTKSSTKAKAKTDDDTDDLEHDIKSDKISKKVKDDELSEDLEKKSVISSVASKAIAKVVSSIIPEKDEEQSSEDTPKSEKSDKASSVDKSSKLDKEDNKLEKEAKVAKKTVSALRADGKDDVNELDDQGPKTVIAVNSVGFAKVQPLVEEPKDIIEPLSANSIAPDEVAKLERSLKGNINDKVQETNKESDTIKSPDSKSSQLDATNNKSQANLSSSNEEPIKQELADQNLALAQDIISAQKEDKAQSLDKSNKVAKSDEITLGDMSADSSDKQGGQNLEANEADSKDKKVEKKVKKQKADFDSNIYLSEVVGSVAAVVEKMAEEKAKEKKTVNVAELIAKAKNINEAIHREAEKSSKTEKSDSLDTEANYDQESSNKISPLDENEQAKEQVDSNGSESLDQALNTEKIISSSTTNSAQDNNDDLIAANFDPQIAQSKKKEPNSSSSYQDILPLTVEEVGANNSQNSKTQTQSPKEDLNLGATNNETNDSLSNSSHTQENLSTKKSTNDKV